MRGPEIRKVRFPFGPTPEAGSQTQIRAASMGTQSGETKGDGLISFYSWLQTALSHHHTLDVSTYTPLKYCFYSGLTLTAFPMRWAGRSLSNVATMAALEKGKYSESIPWTRIHSFSRTITFTLTFLPGETDSVQCKMPLVKYNSVHHTT